VFAIAHFAWGFIADTTRDCDVQSQFRRFLWMNVRTGLPAPIRS
jgi:hypothetical protein